MSQTTTASSEESEPQGLAANATEHVVDGVTRVLTKPRFRGWIHVYSAGTAVFAGASLVAVSWAAGFDPRRPGDAALHGGHGGDVHRQRHLSPRALEIRDAPRNG